MTFKHNIFYYLSCQQYRNLSRFGTKIYISIGVEKNFPLPIIILPYNIKSWKHMQLVF